MKRNEFAEMLREIIQEELGEIVENVVRREVKRTVKKVLGYEFDRLVEALEEDRNSSPQVYSPQPTYQQQPRQQQPQQNGTSPQIQAQRNLFKESMFSDILNETAPASAAPVAASQHMTDVDSTVAGLPPVVANAIKKSKDVLQLSYQKDAHVRRR